MTVEIPPPTRGCLSSLLLKSTSPYPVYRGIVDALTPADIVNLSRTCKGLLPAYDDFLRSRMNINVALQRYTDNPKRFRSVLNRCNAVISGSFALDFFDRNLTEASQLEIVMGAYGTIQMEDEDYVGWKSDTVGMPSCLIRSGNCERIFRWLVDYEGYELVEDDLADDDAIFNRGDGSPVIGYTETLRRSERGPRIRLSHPYIDENTLQNEEHIHSRMGPRLYGTWSGSRKPHSLGDLISAFTTTACANFILGDRAISMFPQLTFIRRVAYSTSESVYMDLDYGKCAQPLTRRHILAMRDFFPPLAPDLIRSNHPAGRVGPSTTCWLRCERRITGPMSWVVPLDMDGVESCAVPTQLIDGAFVTLDVLSQTPCGAIGANVTAQGQRLLLDSVTLCGGEFQYSYCAPKPGLPPSGERQWNLDGSTVLGSSHPMATFIYRLARKLELDRKNGSYTLGQRSFRRWFLTRSRKLLLPGRVDEEFKRCFCFPEGSFTTSGLPLADDCYVWCVEAYLSTSPPCVWPEYAARRIQIPGIAPRRDQRQSQQLPGAALAFE